MPIKNGRIYVNTDETPNIGISIAEIARCIGVGSEDLGTLISHKNNNMWSRKKPVVINTLDVNYNVPDWWRGAEGNCGVEPPARVTSFSALLSQYDGKLNGWKHIRPHQYFRVLDYNGYYHYAKAPIIGIDSQAQYFKVQNESIDVSIAYNDNDVDETGSGSLKMSEIWVDNQSLDKWYVGVAIFNEDGEDVVGFVANQQGEKIETIKYPNRLLIIGKSYILVPFYSKWALDESLGDGDKSIMAIPVVQPVKFKMEDPSKLLFIGADAQWSEDRSSISLYVDVVNNGVGDRPIDSAYARLMVERLELSTPDEYWAANLDAKTDFDIDLGLTYIPKNGINVKKIQSIAQENRDKTYVVLVRIYGAGINFDHGPEYVLYEPEFS
jgi:hypothetical protein